MKNYIYLLSIIALMSLWTACSQDTKSTDESSDTADATGQDTETAMAAFQQMKTTCYVCHSPDAYSDEASLAPPLVEVKKRYMDKYPTQEAFAAAMNSYINKPTEEAALMTEYVERFKLMPDPTISAEEIAKVVNFIYENELAYPEWYKAIHQEKYSETLP